MAPRRLRACGILRGAAILSFGIVTGALLVATAPASSSVTAYPAAYFANYQPNTALDMVGHLPGFTLDTGAGVRGFGGAAGNVLIDGARPASKDDALDETLKRIPAASVLRIELIRGGSPGVDMQGKAVLANVVRRQDRKATAVVAVAIDRWYDGRLGPALRIEGSRRIGATDVEASFLGGKGIDDGAGNGIRIQRDGAGALIGSGPEHSAGEGYNYKVTAAAERRVMGGKLRAHGSLSSNPYSYLQDDRLAPGGERVENDHQNQETAEIGLDYDRPLGAKTRLEAVLLQQLGRSYYMSDFSAPGDIEHFFLGKTTGESIARLTLKASPATSLSLEAGAEGDFNWLNDRTLCVVNAARVAVPAANVRVTEARAEGYATATWRMTPKFTLESGLRVEASRIAATGDVVSSRTLIFPKPRVVATWSPDAKNQVRLRVEREVGQLNFDDFAAGQATLANGAVQAGNPNLIPQRDWVFEAAYERKFLGEADATVTLRHYVLTDIIDRAPVFSSSGVFDAPGNIGGGRKDEVAFALTLPTDKLGVRRGQLTGHATWRWSSVTDPTTGVKREISGLQPVSAAAHFTQGVPWLKMTWGVDVFDQWRQTYYRFNEIDTDQLKTYVSVYGEYKPRTDLAVRLMVENASGRGFEHTRQIYPGPRNTNGLELIDIRNLHTGRGLYVRIRKSFG